MDKNKPIAKEYDMDNAQMFAMFISQKEIYKRPNEGNIFAQTYGLNQGIRKFGEKGKTAIEKDLSQLCNREAFITIEPFLLTEKWDGSIKARVCANGSMQKEYISGNKLLVLQCQQKHY